MTTDGGVYECPDCGTVWTTRHTVRPVRGLPPLRWCGCTAEERDEPQRGRR